MKKLLFISLASIILMPIYSQEKFQMVENSIDTKCKDLIVQLNVLLIFGQQFAKSHQMTAEEYGQYVGEEYVKQGWAKGGNFEALTHACLYNLSCQNSPDDIEVVVNTPDMMRIKSALNYGFIRKQEPCFLITGKDYQDYFTAALSTIAKQGGCNYKVENEGDMVYTTISKK